MKEVITAAKAATKSSKKQLAFKVAPSPITGRVTATKLSAAVPLISGSQNGRELAQPAVLCCPGCKASA